ncbi:MAG TPA: glucose 1-dehydrogenase [Alphaproteobacteria bacterium]|nr:glucose 1-dehydrogenase [Alphaproteobacteria bacterium]
MKVAAITGGGQGIGRATALHFARAGYAVSIADPAVDAGEEAADMIRKAGGSALFIETDVAAVADVNRWIERTASGLGPIDALINNAGISRNRPFLELPSEEFDRVIAVNLRGTFLCGQAAARQMIARKHPGSIVNIASTRAFMSEPGTEAYTASKGGIVALTHGMAISLGPHGIRVNCVSPGWIETRDWQYSGRAKTPQHSERDCAQHPVGRVGKPEDIAEACLFLVEHAGFMTGQNIVIDGGMTVKMIYEE